MEFVTEVTDNFDVSYSYDGLKVIHDHAIDTLKGFLPPFTRKIFNLLGNMWSGQKYIVFNNDLYKEVSIEIPNFDEYGNDFFYDNDGHQVNIDDMNNTSGSDLAIEDSENDIDSDSESGHDQENVSETVVFDGVTVQVNNLHADDSNDDIDFFN